MGFCSYPCKPGLVQAGQHTEDGEQGQTLQEADLLCVNLSTGSNGLFYHENGATEKSGPTSSAKQ